MTCPPSADFDGDQYNHIKSYGEIANESYQRIRKAKSLDEQCKLLLELTDISRTKLRNMSRRRKKIAVQKYNTPSAYYDDTTGIHQNPTKRHYKNIKMVPLILKFKEVVGKPMSNFWDEWAKSLHK